jgi:hypothetical protein
MKVPAYEFRVVHLLPPEPPEGSKPTPPPAFDPEKELNEAGAQGFMVSVALHGGDAVLLVRMNGACDMPDASSVVGVSLVPGA